jgi:hypothetical protein
VSLAACGAGGERAVVRIGAVSITKAGVEHWMAVMAPEGIVPDAPRYSECVTRAEKLTAKPSRAALAKECEQQYATLKRGALEFLISSQWLIDEADDRGLRISRREIRQRLDEQTPTLLPEASGSADLERAARAELAAAKLRETLDADEPKITPATVASYYREHRQRFFVPERRYFNIDNLLSEVEARRVKSELEAGLTLSTLALHETLERPASPNRAPEEPGSAKHAIFTARPHVLTGPVLVDGEHSLFVITRITAAHYRSLAQVRRQVTNQLTREQEQRALAAFSAAWRRKWQTLTSCQRGYVVPQCKQYAGGEADASVLALE